MEAKKKRHLVKYDDAKTMEDGEIEMYWELLLRAKNCVKWKLLVEESGIV